MNDRCSVPGKAGTGGSGLITKRYKPFIFEVEIEPALVVAGSATTNPVTVVFDPPQLTSRVGTGVLPIFSILVLGLESLREAEIHISGGTPGCKIYFPNLYNMLESNLVSVFNLTLTPTLTSTEKTLYDYQTRIGMSASERFTFQNSPPAAAQLRRISVTGVDTERVAVSSDIAEPSEVYLAREKMAVFVNGTIQHILSHGAHNTANQQVQNWSHLHGLQDVCCAAAGHTTSTVYLRVR